jgi:hypothetical protein
LNAWWRSSASTSRFERAGGDGTPQDALGARTICVTINWKEVCKFLSGAFFVSTGVLFYLYVAGSPVPVVGAHLAVTPTVNGVRAAVHAILFIVFFYLGYIRK